jgi:hypothetical protein
MANPDNPSGFRVVGNARTGTYLVAAGNTISEGDFVGLDSDGKAVLASATSADLLGVACYDATDGQSIAVYDDPETEYVGQCSGVFARNMIGTECDIEGTTGIMEVNEDAHAKNTIRILGFVPSSEIGANTEVIVRISKHALGESPTGPLVADTTGTHTGDVVTDLISEKTSANGVEIDGCLVKDGKAAAALTADSADALTSYVTDTIAESTPAAGVTIDGCLVKDGKAAAASTADSADALTSYVTDTIAESTPAAGVTIDGCLVKDGVAAAADTAASCTGNAATATAMAGALVRTTAEYRPTRLVALVDWAQISTGPGLQLAAEKTGATMMGQVEEPEGRTLTAWKLAGIYTEAAGVSGTAQLLKRSAAGADTAVGAVVNLAKDAGALAATETLGTAEVLAAGSKYFVLVTATTGAGDAIGIFGIEAAAK